MGWINRYTGQRPTAKDIQAMKRRAKEILNNPYAAPEQLEWAIMVDPEAFAEVFANPCNVRTDR